ncbi:hypothetical protein CN205_14790 [Sinorhizobium meliloti]|uniref:hypothetical protein n=1 Tax=Rhizobium meliloti TaxID=382 RepID=UPI000FDAA13D|nr:hypothetical protein [Sinorhizobium meliloti]RVI06225.1 hypothetical protein CN205_14790 [Sinorhizobium meliloti]
MDKIEKVARAICAANGHDPDRTLKADVFDDDAAFNGKPFWRKYEKDARVFIAAQAALETA